jgi:predicted secreted protein
MVSVAPDGVVTVSETGDGRWRVAVLPLGVTTVTEVSETGTVVVVVPPFEVRTLETTGDEAIGAETVCPAELTYETVLTDGSGDELTNSVLGTMTVTPDSVTTGVDQAGAGV